MTEQSKERLLRLEGDLDPSYRCVWVKTEGVCQNLVQLKPPGPLPGRCVWQELLQRADVDCATLFRAPLCVSQLRELYGLCWRQEAWQVRAETFLRRLQLFAVQLPDADRQVLQECFEFCDEAKRWPSLALFGSPVDSGELREDESSRAPQI